DTCLLGYNRRNLITMRIEDNTGTVLEQMRKIASPRVLESGLTYGTIDPHLVEEFDGFLIGTSLLNTQGATR
ncbi:indole-3-glycerol-phosphate synthase, partial [mine drainage metagenome]